MRRESSPILYDQWGQSSIVIERPTEFGNYSSIQEVLSKIKDNSGIKPKGGDQLLDMLNKFQNEGEVRLFIPWAASRGGRPFNQIDQSTIDGIVEAIIGPISSLGNVKALVMFANTYATANGFDLNTAGRYWAEVSDSFTQSLGANVQFTASSLLSGPKMDKLLAEEAYAFEKMPNGTGNKVLGAAERYTPPDSPESPIEAARRYAMWRAAEARYVKELSALWVSPNFPERDSMCGEAPRLYLPEDIRAPWLKKA